ncbi:hypothetical protein V5O48_011504 [Marasmius crinis-equi]|uniref:Uncharacterized protein n=1 Tax=Marasmius crinis-equi TaxID=585013 RepID=A0ABR3F5G2_9AGAR
MGCGFPAEAPTSRTLFDHTDIDSEPETPYGTPSLLDVIEDHNCEQAQGIEEFQTTISTFVDILEFAMDEKLHTFPVQLPSTLKILDVRTPLREASMSACLDCDGFAEAMTTLLENCTESLQRLWIWSTSNLPMAGSILHLPALIEYIGPQDLLLGLKFGASQGIDDVERCPNLTRISLLRWAVSDMPVEKVLFSFRLLSELSLEPSTPVSKERLLGLGAILTSMPNLKGLSILRPPKPPKKLRNLSLKDKAGVLAVWKDKCSTLAWLVTLRQFMVPAFDFTARYVASSSTFDLIDLGSGS